MLRTGVLAPPIACLAVIVLAIGSAASAAEPDTPVFWAAASSPQGKQIRQVLNKPLAHPGLAFEEVPLVEVTELLRREHGLEVHLDLPALDSLGIAPDDPVSVRMQRGTLAAAVRLMLKPLDLAYVIDDQVLLITSEEVALTRLTVAVYPVGDLLQTKQPDSAIPLAGTPAPENVHRLVDTIISCVASDTWVANGGVGAEIQVLQPGLLVVSQTEDVHAEIAGLLQALRDARRHPYAVPHAERPHEEQERSGTFGDSGGGFF